MIGIILDENYTIVEFKPIYANYKFGFSFKIPFIANDKKWGEYGFSFAKDGIHLYNKHSGRHIYYRNN